MILKKGNWTKFIHALLVIASALSIYACKTESPIELNIPDTYAFERDGQTTVDFSGQTERQDMLGELELYMRETRKLNGKVDANRLLAMYANESGADFSGTYAKNLKSKTFQADVSFFEGLLNEMATASEQGGEAAPGKSGFLSEVYGISTANESHAGYLVNEKGLEYHQVFTKALMGAVFYYQAMEVYLSQDRMGSIGNDDLAEGKNYTNMEHYFDEAFGYFGVPLDFPSNTEDIRYWGEYCNTRNQGSGTGKFTYPEMNEAIMDAWLKARAAIVVKDYDTRDEAITEIAARWEQIIGASAADYLERSKSSYGAATYRKHHFLSEGIGFMLALKYHFEGGNAKVPRISDPAKIDEALGVIGLETDLWTISDTDLDQAINLIIDAFPEGLLE